MTISADVKDQYSSDIVLNAAGTKVYVKVTNELRE